MKTTIEITEETSTTTFTLKRDETLLYSLTVGYGDWRSVWVLGLCSTLTVDHKGSRITFMPVPMPAKG